MPTYDYQCECGHVFEKVYSLAEYDKKPTPICPECYGYKTNRVMLPGHGGIQCDSANDVKWLKSAEEVIKPGHEHKPWESRKDYRECLKRNGLEASR